MNLTKKEISEIKEHAIEIPTKGGDEVSSILKKLVQLHNDGYYNYYVEIYGDKYYSVDVDYERDFKKIVGMTEAELNEVIAKEQERTQRERALLEKDAKENLNKRIATGNKYISKAKQNEWERKVIRYSEALYNSVIDYIIKYLEILSDKEKINLAADEYLKELPYSTTDWYQMMILSDIARFSDNGIEFFTKVIELAKEKNMHINRDKEYIRELRKINKYINQGVDYEKAYSLLSQRAYKLRITDDFSSEDRKSYEICALKKDNFFTGIDQEGNLFIAEIINNTIFHGYYIFNSHQEKLYITGEIKGNNVTAFTAQSELLDFVDVKNEVGIITIDITPSRRNLILIDKEIKQVIESSNPVILARIYNQLSIETAKCYQKLEEKEYKKALTQ